MSPRRRTADRYDDREPDLQAMESMDALQQLEVFREFGAYARPDYESPVDDGGYVATTWCVLIEEQVGGREYREWELTSIEESRGDRAAATQLAEELSRNYQPRHPMSPRDRTRYRTADGWVVVVEGMMSEFRFRLTLAERMPD